jgi:hypothetical protein
MLRYPIAVSAFDFLPPAKRSFLLELEKTLWHNEFNIH